MKIISIIGLLFCCILDSRSQTTKYSQYNNAPIFTNPAMIVGDQAASISLQYRKMSLQQNQGFSLPSLTFSSPIRYKKKTTSFGAASAALIQQRSGTNGVFLTTGFSGGFAYKINLNSNNFLSTALQGAYYNTRTDPSRFTTDSQYQNGYDPSLPSGESLSFTSDNFFQLNAGLAWFHKDKDGLLQSWLGGAVYSLNRPSITFFNGNIANGKSPLALSFSGGVNIPSSNNFIFTPSFRYVQEQSLYLINIGLETTLVKSEGTKITLGTYYNTNKSIILFLGVKINTIYLSFGYDQNLSGAKEKGTSLNAMEALSRYYFK